MDRRSFLFAAAAGGAAIASGAIYRRWHEITPVVHAPGRALGHYLRDRGSVPPPAQVIETDIAIVGAGMAGLTAAWQLRRDGHADFLVIDGPEPFGNAAGGRDGELAFPTGAHYLPVPSRECAHVRAILADLDILQRDADADKPTYDERYLLHAPEERLLVNGHWHEGIVPRAGVPAAELAEHARFFAEVDRLRGLHGADGRRVFALPSSASSLDPAWLALDCLTLRDWFEQHGYRSPTLYWYLDYCCRDDYGATAATVSAWAGLHYFCARGGEAANAASGAWLTWPGGLQPLASALAERSSARRLSGAAVSIREVDGKVEILCCALEGGRPRSYLVRARKAICAMPLFVASRVVENIAAYGFDPRQHLPATAPWLVANFMLRGFPDERPEAPLCWDNVVHRTEGGPNLGYVVSTHQDIRVTPPERTVFTTYAALSHLEPLAARRWLQAAAPDELLALAAADLHAAYGSAIDMRVERVDITLRAHAMAIPRPGFRSNAGLAALRAHDGPVLFAHADLSGFSVFEEASWWGVQAARRAQDKTGA
ncbi:NAD(P)/FAD-dependent oxidoreductase [Massilia sp. YMA4]|uniref:FAD-dependent oxidoreductase n=1 Tax=Massilia sp. YMA4 TaxID=1593482 RepID=UPI000DD0FC25|nr:NAD(P)/FAD-dependent oxidoreductase [Massilia sp. YMA4]AXA93205.1 amine oxidase [Massilia sp. YMA4]